MTDKTVAIIFCCKGHGYDAHDWRQSIIDYLETSQPKTYYTDPELLDILNEAIRDFCLDNPAGEHAFMSWFLNAVKRAKTSSNYSLLHLYQKALLDLPVYNVGSGSADLINGFDREQVTRAVELLRTREG